MQLRADEYGDADEVETFVINKLDDLTAYDEVIDELRQGWALQSPHEHRRETEGFSALFPLSSSMIDGRAQCDMWLWVDGIMYIILVLR